jgi:hypothetical protein
MESSADRNATLGAVFIIGGAAAVVAGGVSYFLGHRQRAQATGTASLELRPTVAPEPGGARAGLSLGMEF